MTIKKITAVKRDFKRGPTSNRGIQNIAGVEMARPLKTIAGILSFFMAALPCSVSMAEFPSTGSRSSQENVLSTTNLLVQRLLNMNDDAPGWLKRTTFNLQFEEGYTPSVEIESVQPLYSPSEDDVFFLQLNMRSKDWNETYNLGLGYRNIVAGRVILGVNGFYDYSEQHAHRRYGFGIEALGRRFEARANSYFQESGEREVQSGVFQRVMGGYDVEVGGSVVPFYEDLKIYAGYRWFDSKHTKDLKSLTFRATLPVNRYLGLEVKYLKNVDRDKSAFESDVIFAQLLIGLDNPIKGAVGEGEDLKSRLLVPVERENDIIVEEYSPAAGGFTVVVKRGS